MEFPLMRGYDLIIVVSAPDPVMAVKDSELGDRFVAYPKLLPAGVADFGYAVQTGPTWRVGTVSGPFLEDARHDLTVHLREAARKGTDARDALLAAARRLDPEQGEKLAEFEWEIGGHRYRVIRIEQFTLGGDGEMEPPRSTDTDPLPGTASYSGRVIDPMAAVAHWEAQLRLNLVGCQPIPHTVSDMVRTEARIALETHPGVVLLPPCFAVVEIEGRAMQAIVRADGADEARENLAAYLTRTLPRLREATCDPADPVELAEWAEAAEQVRATTGPRFCVLGRRFQTVRISRFLRLGRDGPEPPRPSDLAEYQ